MELTISNLPKELQEAAKEEMKNFPIVLSIRTILGWDKEVIVNEIILANSGSAIEEIRYWGVTNGVKYKTFDVYSMKKLIQKYEEVKRSGKY